MFSIQKQKSQEELQAEKEAKRLALLNWIPSEIARQPGILEGYKEKLLEDQRTHSISFIRYGDHVCVMQERISTNWYGVTKFQKTMSAVNLGRTEHSQKNPYSNQTQVTLRPANIRLVPGKEPNLDNSGWAYYTSIYQSDNTYKEEMRSSIGYSGNSLNARIQTGLASEAESDSIVFDGAGVTISLPFGTGDTVFKELMEALTKGA